MGDVEFDVLVVGSGPSGVHAAQAALAGGARVGLADVGHADSTYSAITPDRPFAELRATDAEQHRYLLGLDEEGLHRARDGVGAQLTPARLHMLRDVERLLPLESPDFRPLQSLALGGLGVAWGAGCAAYEDFELRRVGLDPAPMRRHYRHAADEIGVSGDAGDDVAACMAGDLALQPPLELDAQGESLLATYERRRAYFGRLGFRLGRHPLAVLTRELDGRSVNRYHDMDFWSDAGESVWRPWYTLRKLERNARFHYVPGFLALRFEADRDEVTLIGRDLSRGDRRRLRGRCLLLAAGALNSARLALRSLGLYGRRVPLLCNPYTYAPAVNLRLLGREVRDRRHSLVQLCGVLRPATAPEHLVVANFFSYRSLLLFRLARAMPLPPALAMLAARVLVTGLVVVGIHQPDGPSTSRWLALRRGGDADGGDDTLQARYQRSAQERRCERARERRLAMILLRLGCVPLGFVYPAHGGSIHYAGTLPFDTEERVLTCDSRGRLRGARRVYVADGAAWRWLPAKALTLSLMANARRVAECALEDLASKDAAWVRGA